MRKARWLLVLAILGLLAGIGATYRSRKADLQKHAAAKPVALPFGLSGKLENWHWSHTDQGHPVVDIHAKGVKQENDSSKVQLDDVELRIYKKKGDEYDLVHSAQAEFDQSADRLYSSGEVDITLNLPVEGQPTHTPVTIRSSGVTFETKSGKAYTDQPTHFKFENGEGDSHGANYDPATRELHLLSQVSLDWKAATPAAKPMRIETAELNYKEGSSIIWLKPWARLKREDALMEAAATLVTLQDGVIHQVDAVAAHGTAEYPRRSLQYAADELHVTYNDDGQIDRVTGNKNAKLVSVSEGSQTTMTTDVVYLDFENLNGDSNLKKVLGNGHTVVESKPLPVAGTVPPETRVLRSETVEIRMRPGGREIERVLARAPGNLEFLPNSPTQRRRTLDGDDMDIVYGAQNQIQSFRCVNARTRTEPTPEEAAKKRAVSTTRSKHLAAEFEKNGQMKRMEQWDDFAYEEGERRAQAGHAELDYASNLITLQKKARMSDASATTSADRIKLDQKSGDFAADGHVTSSRMPDKKTTTTEMLSGDEPIQAMAEHMTAANHNRLIHYDTHAVMWQGPDRVQADRIDLDRDKRTLAAKGGVITNMREKGKPPEGQAGKPAADAAPIFTVVKADALLYTEQDRLAHYNGHVTLNRPNLRVKAGELRAFLTESKPKPPESAPAEKTTEKTEDKTEDSRLEKAFADGKVEIVQTGIDRTRTGLGEHAEYYTLGEERILIRGGEPQFIDSLRGNTRGTELTYFVNDDRLLVTGGPGARTASRLLRK